jgi:transposase
MARKNYTEEFRRQAVDLYRSTPGATLRGIATDLGISPDVASMGARAGCGPDEPLVRALVGAAARQGQRAGRPESAETELASLRTRVAALETENVKLETERDILRQAAKYFAGETNW